MILCYRKRISECWAAGKEKVEQVKTDYRKKLNSSEPIPLEKVVKDPNMVSGSTQSKSSI